MLGLRGAMSLGARRHRFAGGGLTPAIATLAALLLSACQAPQHQLRLAGAEDIAAPVQHSTPNSPAPDYQAAAPKPDTLPKQTPLATTPAVARAEAVIPMALRLTGDPEELLGLDHALLRRILGMPAQVRREWTAEVWQYVTGDCVVDLYLYGDDESGALKVTYVEARSRTAEQTPTTRCLKSLLERPTASVQ